MVRRDQTYSTLQAEADRFLAAWIVVIFFSATLPLSFQGLYRKLTKAHPLRLSPSASFVALGMAEIVSAIPSAGGPYYWAAIIAPRRSSAFWSWVTGWANFGVCRCSA